ncbi:MAG: tetratricopeptide repeat protein [Deltaproteobacteria bacterium]|nr:tetratricopeptide repeat protein [Deltaproteobacteria bacterium]
MSLIHQALKKLEGDEPGHSPSANQATMVASRTIAANRYLAASALTLLVLAVSATFSYKFISSRGEKTSMQAPAAVLPAATVQDKKPELKKESALERNEQGIIFYRSGHFIKAREEFKAALAVNSQDAVLQNNFGLASMALGNDFEAEEAFKKALELNPNYPEALNNYGGLLDKRGEYIKAIEYFQRALKLRPEYSEARLNMAISLEKLNRANSALKQYEEFLKSSADNVLNEEVRKKVLKLKPALILKQASE